MPASTRRDAGAAAPSVTRRDEPGTASPAGDHGGLPAPVFDEYEPVEALRAGGEAHRVMKVRHRRNNTFHVVKVYGEAIRPDPDLLAALRRADQAHLVRIDDWGDATDQYGHSASWEVLEFVPGGSLRDLIAAEGPALDEDLVRRILIELTDALDHLHTAVDYEGSTGLAHRDIKPENILVRDRDELDLVLCDFGLVAEIRATRMTSRRAGTAEYQAPETWHTPSRDAAQDWWSLGVLIVELVAGRNPNAAAMGARGDDRALFTHLTGYGVDLSDITDPRWRLLCAGLLTFAPHHRWRAHEVREWLAGRSPIVHSGRGEQTAEPVAAPIEVAGQVCRDPVEVARAFHENWRAATRQFVNRELRLALSDWLDDNFADVRLPKDLFRTDADSRDKAGERIARFISWVAPELPPVYADRAMDAAGIVTLADRAMAGDTGAAARLKWLDAGWLTVFARHACRVHPECADDTGCVRLRTAATRVDRAREMLADRAGQLAPALASPLDDAELVAADAKLVQVLVDPAAAAALQASLPKKLRRVDWWRQLADEGTRTTDEHGTVALVLAGATTGRASVAVASAAAADREATQLLRRQRKQNVRAVLRRMAPLGRDVVSWVLALALAYLATFFAVLLVARIKETAAEPAVLAAAIAELQTRIALPLAILLACVLIRPRTPLSAGMRANQVVLAAGVASAAAIASLHGELLDFPVRWQTGVRDGLTALNRTLVGGPDTLIATLVIVAMIGLILANRIVAITRRTERSGSRAAMAAKRVLVGAVVVVLAVRTGVLLLDWRIPDGLPDPALLWFTI